MLFFARNLQPLSPVLQSMHAVHSARKVSIFFPRSSTTIFRTVSLLMSSSSTIIWSDKRRHDSNQFQQWPVDSARSIHWKKSVLILYRFTASVITYCTNVSGSIYDSPQQDYGHPTCKQTINLLWCYSGESDHLRGSSASRFSEADGKSMCFQKVSDHVAASKAIFPEESYLHNFIL